MWVEEAPPEEEAAPGEPGELGEAGEADAASLACGGSRTRLFTGRGRE